LDQNLILTSQTGHLAFVVFNRPEKRNSLNYAMLEALPRVLRELTKNPDLRVIIFRGSGEAAFCAGGDISEFKKHAESRQNAEQWHEILVGAIESVYKLEIPTIAMVHGPAAGAGCEIALACDIRLAAPDARFGITGSRLGFSIPFRNAVRLVSLVGPAYAKKMLYTGEFMPAEEAFRMGLATAVVDKEDLEKRTLELAGEIAANAPLAQRAIKRTIDRVVQDPSLSSVKEPSHWFVETFLSRDLQEGVKAFLEKRKPVFTGE
jgi:enoyl-CoA hydratase/carnithine racemase